jgi:hypothetical protein
MIPMKFELLQQVIDKVLGAPKVPRITVRDVEDGLREVFRHDPLRAERAIGNMYGYMFKKKEAIYDAAGGRRP